jgi:hypothetical protein
MVKLLDIYIYNPNSINVIPIIQYYINITPIYPEIIGFAKTHHGINGGSP